MRRRYRQRHQRRRRSRRGGRRHGNRGDGGRGGGLGGSYRRGVAAGRPWSGAWWLDGRLGVASPARPQNL